MFELRIICYEPDANEITQALSEVFTTGETRTYPSRYIEGMTRVYLRAELPTEPSDPQDGPTAEEAYALAPSIISEIGWTARTAADKPFGEQLGREYWLRKAAALDRIAIGSPDESDDPNDAAEIATEAARHLMNADGVNAACTPRMYIRRAYMAWATNH